MGLEYTFQPPTGDSFEAQQQAAERYTSYDGLLRKYKKLQNYEYIRELEDWQTDEPEEYRKSLEYWMSPNPDGNLEYDFRIRIAEDAHNHSGKCDLFLEHGSYLYTTGKISSEDYTRKLQNIGINPRNSLRETIPQRAENPTPREENDQPDTHLA